MVKALQERFRTKIDRIEECVLHSNCLVDIVVTTKAGQKIAIIAASKLVRKTGKATSIHARTIKVEYTN